MTRSRPRSSPIYRDGPESMHHPIDDEELEVGLEVAARILKRAGRVAALTGAGVSAESGMATFRGPDGLWEGHRVEDVATPAAFERDPEMVWRFYHARRAALRDLQPNPGHTALATLESRYASGHFVLSTQNVDGLHRAAGSRHLLELHGSLARVRCTECGDRKGEHLNPLPPLPKCDRCGALLRPDVVWFYEALPEDAWTAAERSARLCDCFLVVGTSAVVYPAAELIEIAARRGTPVLEVNPAKTPATPLSRVHLHGPSGQVLPRLLAHL